MPTNFEVKVFTLHPSPQQDSRKSFEKLIFSEKFWSEIKELKKGEENSRHPLRRIEKIFFLFFLKLWKRTQDTLCGGPSCSKRDPPPLPGLRVKLKRNKFFFFKFQNLKKYIFLNDTWRSIFCSAPICRLVILSLGCLLRASIGGSLGPKKKKKRFTH